MRCECERRASVRRRKERERRESWAGKDDEVAASSRPHRPRLLTSSRRHAAAPAARVLFDRRASCRAQALPPQLRVTLARTRWAPTRARRRAARRIRGGAASRKSGSRAVRSTIPHDGSSLSDCSQAGAGAAASSECSKSTAAPASKSEREEGEPLESSVNEGRLGPLRPPREREKERSSCCAMRRSRGSVAAAQRLEFRS